MFDTDRGGETVCIKRRDIFFIVQGKLLIELWNRGQESLTPIQLEDFVYHGLFYRSYSHANFCPVDR
jgi:hypothetical protein